MNLGERSQGLFLCMLGMAVALNADRIGARRQPRGEAPRRAKTRPAAPSAPLAGAFLADIDGRLLPSPHPPVGAPVTLTVAGTGVRAVRLELEDRRAPYYLDENGRMLETEWRWVDGAMQASVRYRRGTLEVPSPS